MPSPKRYSRTPNSLQALALFNQGGFSPARRECRAAEIGGGGAVANGRGLARIFAPFACGGELDGREYVDPTTLSRMSEVAVATHEDATLLIPTRFGLGFMKSMDNRATHGFTQDSVVLGSEAFGHVGAGGSIGFADPARRMSFGYAMNRMGPGILMNERGQTLIDTAYEALWMHEQRIRCVALNRHDRNRHGGDPVFERCALERQGETMRRLMGTIAMIGLSFLLSGCSDPDIVPETHISTPPSPARAVEVERFPLRTALFGDLHVHTSWSADAYTGGNRLGPNTAYRFARGEKVELQTGAEAQLQTPLDFVALTDHAEGFETQLPCTMMPGSPEFGLQQCPRHAFGRLRSSNHAGASFCHGRCTAGAAFITTSAVTTHGAKPMRMTPGSGCKRSLTHTDEPGRFTALIGYEFSSLLTEMGMLHRNVIFRGTDVIPHAISSLDVRNQKDFFDQLDAACNAPCEVLTIPHNTNYSWGLTFSRTDEDGSRLFE